MERDRHHQHLAEVRHDDAGLAAPQTTLGGSRVLSSNLDFWSVGIIQSIDAAALDGYLMFRQTSGDATTAVATTTFEPLSMLITGVRITF